MAITRAQQYRQMLENGGRGISLQEAKAMAPKGEFLAYINKKEAKMLKDAGGSGIMTNAGIPSYNPNEDRAREEAANQRESYRGNDDGRRQQRQLSLPTTYKSVPPGEKGGPGYITPEEKRILQKSRDPKPKPIILPKKKPEKTETNYKQPNIFERYFKNNLITKAAQAVSNSKFAYGLNAIQREKFLEKLEEDDPARYAEVMQDLATMGYATNIGPVDTKMGLDVKFTDLGEPQAKAILEGGRKVNVNPNDPDDYDLSTDYTDYLEKQRTRFDPLDNINTGGGGENQQQTDPCLGPNPPAYCNVGNDTEEEDATPSRNLGGLAPRFAGSIFDFTGLADGGRAGYRDGTLPIKKDGFFRSIDFSKMTPEEIELYKLQMEMMKKGFEKKPSPEGLEQLKIEQQIRDQQRKDRGLPEEVQLMSIGGRAGMMDGGMMEDTPEGGIMDLETIRNQYFFGGIVKSAKKAVKSATRAVKKVAKSPIGKLALGFAAYKLGGGFLKGKGLMGTLFGQAGSRVGQPFIPFKEGFLTKLGLTKGGGSLMPTALGGILGATALTGLMTPEEEEEKFNNDEYYAANSLNIPNIRNNPYNYLAPRFAADGGIMRNGYQEGGDAEPVAKKTMPLLDMDGQEMDLREEGGFVPLGRMEKADDVPARLSKNEFVFTADAVRNAGEGDIDKGAEVMYNMMKNLESGGEVSEESQGLEGAREMFQTSQRLEEVI